MMSLLDLARLCGSVYNNPPDAPPGWAVDAKLLGTVQGWNLQAAVYEKQGGGTAVAFRGTNVEGTASTIQDVLDDVNLGLGWNLPRYREAEHFMRHVVGKPGVVITGHSLGGAIAQVIGNRLRLRIATFNAPGVGTIATRNLSDANPIMFGVRAIGTTASAAAYPGQAWSDMKSAFHPLQGINVRLDGDVVSQIGSHYGRLLTVPGPGGASAFQQHMIGTVIDVLQRRAEVGGRDILSFA